MTPVTVAIVEDHLEFREALCQALGGSDQTQVVGVCKDLPAGLQLLERVCPDVLLVDLGLPSGSGLALIREATRRCGAACTSAVLTVTGNEEHLLTAIGVGAKGYLFKSDQPQDWLQTVRMLAQGQSPLHANLAQSFLQLAIPADGFGEPALAVLQHIAAGYTAGEAATRLGISLFEVGTRMRSVYEQLRKEGPSLSTRELELLTLLNKGFAFRECATLMGVSESTLKTLAKRAYQKLDAGNLQTALYEARAANLIA